MKLPRKLSVPLLSGAACLGILSVAIAATPPGPAHDKNVVVEVVSGSALLQARSGASVQMPVRSQQMSLTSGGPSANVQFDNNQVQWGDDDHVPLWTFEVHDAAATD